MEILIGLAILVGLVGIVVPVLPGSVLIAASVLVWAWFTATPLGWGVFATVVVLVIAGWVGSGLATAHHTTKAGTATSSLVIAGILGIVGFFVIPVVGLFVGFIGGLWLAELRRVRDPGAAWTSAKAGLKGAGFGMLVELTAGLLAAGTWLVAAVLA